MKHYIKIDKEYEIRTVDELTFDEYNTLQRYINNSENPIDLCKYILLTLTEVSLETLEMIDEVSLLNIPYVDLLNRKQQKKFTPNFKDYKLCDIQSMTMGRFIDLEETITKDNVKIEEVVALLFLPDIYDMKIYKDCMDEIKKDMKIGDALQYLEMYKNYRKHFYDDYQGLFQLIEDTDPEDDKYDDDELFDDEKEEQEEEVYGINRWGLLGSVYNLTNGDITKVDEIMKKPHLEVFNFMSYQKDIKDYQDEMEKRANTNRIH